MIRLMSRQGYVERHYWGISLRSPDLAEIELKQCAGSRSWIASVGGG